MLPGLSGWSRALLQGEDVGKVARAAWVSGEVLAAGVCSRLRSQLWIFLVADKVVLHLGHCTAPIP
jgi:membrane glycosyltransferase